MGCDVGGRKTSCDHLANKKFAQINTFLGTYLPSQGLQTNRVRNSKSKLKPKKTFLVLLKIAPFCPVVVVNVYLYPRIPLPLFRTYLYQLTHTREAEYSPFIGIGASTQWKTRHSTLSLSFYLSLSHTHTFLLSVGQQLAS